MRMEPLTKQQIQRQDFVDNQIFELLQQLLPHTEKLAWDITMIGAVRDAIREQIVDQRQIMSEEEFYP